MKPLFSCEIWRRKLQVHADVINCNRTAPGMLLLLLCVVACVALGALLAFPSLHGVLLSDVQLLLTCLQSLSSPAVGSGWGFANCPAFQLRANCLQNLTTLNAIAFAITVSIMTGVAVLVTIGSRQLWKNRIQDYLFDPAQLWQKAVTKAFLLRYDRLFFKAICI
jgi:hypothetical protein